MIYVAIWRHYTKWIIIWSQNTTFKHLIFRNSIYITVTYDYLFRRLPSEMDRNNMWFSYGVVDILGSTKVLGVEVRDN